MTMTENIADLAAALAKAQSAIKGAAKDKANPYFKSRYADLASVWDACRKALTDNGLSVVQLPALSDAGVSVTTILMHASGQYIESELSSPVKEIAPQPIGSVITYLRRYALAAIAGVAPDDDDDAEAGMGRKHGNGAAANGHPAAPKAQEPSPEADALEHEFSEAIDQCKDIPKLGEIAKPIKAAFDAGKIGPVNRKRLMDKYTAKLTELGQAN